MKRRSLIIPLHLLMELLKIVDLSNTFPSSVLSLDLLTLLPVMYLSVFNLSLLSFHKMDV